MSRAVDFSSHADPKEIAHILFTENSQVIRHLVHNPDGEADVRLYHAKGQAARLTHNWKGFIELANQPRSAENAVRLYMFMAGASGSGWKESLSSLIRHLSGKTCRTVGL